MIQEGAIGLLMSVDNNGEIGDALAALVVEPSRRSAMSQNHRSEATRDFDARTNARQALRFVRSRR
jgi:hypothetical protein